MHIEKPIKHMPFARDDIYTVWVIKKPFQINGYSFSLYFFVFIFNSCSFPLISLQILFMHVQDQLHYVPLAQAKH